MARSAFFVLHSAARVGDEHARLRLLELDPSGNRAQHSGAAPEESTHGRTGAAGVVLGKHDRRREHEIGGDHLSAAHIRALAQLARRGQRALLHQVPHAGAALDDDEAVRLLNHHPNESDRRRQVVARQRDQHFVLRLDDGHGAHRGIAVFELLVTFRTLGAGRTFDDAASLALFGLSNFLCPGRRSQQRDTNDSKDRRPKSEWVHRRPPARLN